MRIDLVKGPKVSGEEGKQMVWATMTGHSRADKGSRMCKEQSVKVPVEGKEDCAWTQRVRKMATWEKKIVDVIM